MLTILLVLSGEPCCLSCVAGPTSAAPCMSLPDCHLLRAGPLDASPCLEPGTWQELCKPWLKESMTSPDILFLVRHSVPYTSSEAKLRCNQPQLPSARDTLEIVLEPLVMCFFTYCSCWAFFKKPTCASRTKWLDAGWPLFARQGSQRAWWQPSGFTWLSEVDHCLAACLSALESAMKS